MSKRKQEEEENAVETSTTIKRHKANDGSVQILCGDLRTCGKQYIAHQTNCTHKGKAAGLARAIFSAFPYADCYKKRSKVSIPGSIEICKGGNSTQGVINMFAQYHKGTPRGKRDTAEMRREWFQDCLNVISSHSGIQEIAFPYGIGCGLAGGSWFDYLAMITHWAASHPHIKVSVILLPRGEN